jgi:hypothetical protein
MERRRIRCWPKGGHGVARWRWSESENATAPDFNHFQYMNRVWAGFLKFKK